MNIRHSPTRRWRNLSSTGSVLSVLLRRWSNIRGLSRSERRGLGANYDPQSDLALLLIGTPQPWYSALHLGSFPPPPLTGLVPCHLHYLLRSQEAAFAAGAEMLCRTVPRTPHGRRAWPLLSSAGRLIGLGIPGTWMWNPPNIRSFSFSTFREKQPRYKQNREKDP